MRVIQGQAKAAAEILGAQSGDWNRPLRFLTYCGIAPCAEGTLLYNVLTKEMILAEPADLPAKGLDPKHPESLRSCGDLFAYLYEHWYLVPVENDDRELCRNLRELARRWQRANAPKGFIHYTILTTTDCNARCAYCYEAGVERRDMSRETAHRVADFIADNWASVKRTERPEHPARQVTLQWFGGEPLVNMAAIDQITQELTRREIPYESSMITNGSLLTEEVVRRAVRDWHVKNIQITLDGTEDVYNRAKAYVDDPDSAYRRVTANIKSALEAGMAVSVRLNLTGENLDDLYQLVDELAARFGEYPKFHLYAAYVYCLRDDTFNQPYREDLETLSNQRLALTARIRERGLLTRSRLRRSVKTNQCMADNDTTTLIQADGSLGRCEHHYDSMPCGTVAEGITDPEMVAYWKQQDPDAAVCADCPIYPDCLRLTGCHSIGIAACQRVAAVREDIVPSLMSDMLDCFTQAKQASHEDRKGNALR